MLSVVKSKRELGEKLQSCREQKLKIAFVPTMGALHDGHLSLVEKACNTNDICVVSIFVNPTQFNEKNDFDNYPRLSDRDIDMLRQTDCNFVYVPDVNDIYTESNFDLIHLDLGLLTKVLEARYRPGHFDGVITVVKKLFDIVQPDIAYFGQKDYQQYLVIDAMKRHFNMNIEIIALPTRREKDGLAMSSRNMLLTEENRNFAPEIYQSLLKAQNMLKIKTPDEIKNWAAKHLNAFEAVNFEYFEILNAKTLEHINRVDDAEEIVICTALKLGEIRLVDNVLVKL